METSPFKSSDKAVGYALIALGALALGTGLYFALPILIELAKNTIILVGELVVLAFLAIVFLDKNTWTNIYYGWRNVSRKIRKTIIREDPVGILATVIARFQTKLEEIDENINKAVGAYKRHMSTIAKAEKAQKDELAFATVAQRAGKDLETRQHATAAARWEKTADELRPMGDTLLNVKTSLERARDLCSTKLEDLSSQKQVLALKLEAMQDSQTAVRGFKRFFGNNPDLEMQDMAIEEIERQSNEAEAEIEQFIRVMNPMLDAADTKKQAEALAAMEKFNNFLGSQPAPKSLTEGAVEGEVIAVAAPKGVKKLA